MAEADRAARDRRGPFASVPWLRAALNPIPAPTGTCPGAITATGPDALGLTAHGWAAGPSPRLIVLRAAGHPAGLALGGDRHDGWRGVARVPPDEADLVTIDGACRLAP